MSRFWSLSLATLVLILLLPGWRAYREASVEYARWKYSREFVPGMKRRDVERRLSREGSRWSQMYPLNTIGIGLGDVRYTIFCAPTEVSIALEFDMPNLTAPSGDDVLQSVKLVRQERGCM